MHILPTVASNHGPARPHPVGRDRDRSLDGLRGCLAAIVMGGHVLSEYDPQANCVLSPPAVWLFFIISGLVLSRSWDGRYLLFLVRRFVRLWPLFALCIGCGYLLAGGIVSPALFLWVPASNVAPAVDPPAWSLTIEAWAMLAMPIFVWVGRGSLIRLELAILACVGLAYFEAMALFGIFFLAGAWLARYRFHWSVLERAIPQWLGRVSYPLYLSHWLVLEYVPGPIPVRIVVALIVAEALTVTVERWSIAASRAVAPRWPAMPWRRLALP